MGALHLVSTANALDNALQVAASDDALVLLEDGVYAVTRQEVETAVCAMHAIAQDLTLRGLAPQPTLNCISYDELVELCTQHSPITTWC